MNANINLSAADVDAALRMEVAEAFVGQPALIAPQALTALVDFSTGAGPSMFSGGAGLAQGLSSKTAQAEQREGYRLRAGTAVITIAGSLLHRPTYASRAYGITTYQDVSQWLAAAVGDTDVRRILLEIDSPGGTLAGAFALADSIFEARGAGKQIVAVANELAASAAYLIAAAANEVVIPTTARAGSIGVAIGHLNIGKAMEAAGLAMTYIFAGDKKVDGNPFGGLSDRARADMQAEVNEAYDLFVNRVATYRGINADRMRATRAGVFTGQKAIDAGLADRIGSFTDAIKNTRRDMTHTGARMGLAAPLKEMNMSTSNTEVRNEPMTASQVWDAVFEGRKEETASSRFWDEVYKSRDEAAANPAPKAAKQPALSGSTVWDEVQRRSEQAE